jgi:hypothetical protein
MHLNRLLASGFGRNLISILLGLGLATLFRKACKDRSCLSFNGPVISEIDGKTYQFGEYCYKYDLLPVKCDPKKRIVEIDDVAAKVVKEEQKKATQTNPLMSILGR